MAIYNIVVDTDAKSISVMANNIAIGGVKRVCAYKYEDGELDLSFDIVEQIDNTTTKNITYRTETYASSEASIRNKNLPDLVGENKKLSHVQEKIASFFSKKNG